MAVYIPKHNKNEKHNGKTHFNLGTILILFSSTKIFFMK